MGNNRHQERLRHAWEFLNTPEVKKKGEEYTRYCRRLPAFIQTNGLIGATLFTYSKGGTQESIMRNILSWLNKTSPSNLGEDINSLIEHYPQLSTGEIHFLTEEAILYASTLKRLAEGMFGTGEKNEMEKSSS